MSITTKQYQSLQAEALRMAEELPKGQLLDSLVATYEAGRLLHMTKSALVGLLGSIIVRCIDGEVDEDAPLAPPAAGLWPRVIREAAYDELGNLEIDGIDDDEHTWHESVTGRSPEGWLLKQLYVERRFGRRKKGCGSKRTRTAGM
jgi:hypothetical protein